MAVTLYRLLNAATATNGVPTTDAQGIAVTGVLDRGTIALASTAGSGTMTVVLKLWGYVDALSAWCPLGTSGTDANRGLLNGGATIGETSADKLRFAELVDGLSTFTRIYLEITAIGGTNTAVTAWLVPRKPHR